ncbi:helix-turn-helix protein [Arcticibacter tournemirensis]|uniref:Helix-turn-helix domain-containing protein n=1 Tax=Arcticibacter tournemirensis TaxID=699437 RepID=A0A5M9GM06_9SPHI|nr:helix-turn-helix domain-containing protein [Arcticibacter tournemirensis]KAA8474837.1 helix-turn-helix domain-containing protein [Arcticibacter tournemirensis]TQM49638.1 helix-turn-helix protein [Arcticibacter tournemirensis]
MATIDFITREDLENFKQELLAELRRPSFRAPKQEQQKEWLKSYEVRKLLGISPNTLQSLRLNGTLPFTRVGGLIYYAYEDIRKLMEDRKK